MSINAAGFRNAAEPRGHMPAAALRGAGLDPDELLSTSEVAVTLKCSAKHIRKLCKLPKDDHRHLAHVKKGNEYLIPRWSIIDWIARQIEVR